MPSLFDFYYENKCRTKDKENPEAQYTWQFSVDFSHFSILVWSPENKHGINQETTTN